jgi:hypothetical protein
VATKEPIGNTDPEIAAIGEVYGALKGLAPDAQARVLAYVALKLGIDLGTLERLRAERTLGEEERDLRREKEIEGKSDGEDKLEAVSPVARKWMARNGLRPEQLYQLFSLAGDEIDLIAKEVPGKSKRERMRSVFLLKGVAAYLDGGAARFSYQQIKEACLHYDAFDAANFSTHLKSLSAEVSGGKDAGYTLTARGLAGATEMVKSLTQTV